MKPSADSRRRAGWLNRRYGQPPNAKDEIHIGEALENLGGIANATGALPEALQYPTCGLEIHRRLNYLVALPYDLANGADLLIRLNRHGEAQTLLDEIDAAVEKKQDAFLPRARRARALRAMSAAIQLRRDEVARYARDFPQAPDGKPDSSSQLAALLLQCGGVMPGARPRGPTAADRPLIGATTAPIPRELRYWDLWCRLGDGDFLAAQAGAEETLAAAGGTLFVRIRVAHRRHRRCRGARTQGRGPRRPIQGARAARARPVEERMEDRRRCV